MCKRCNQLILELGAVKKDALVWTKRATYHSNRVVELLEEVIKLSTEALERDREESGLEERNKFKENKKKPVRRIGTKREIEKFRALLDNPKDFWNDLNGLEGGAR